jgi:hypothetical protein
MAYVVSIYALGLNSQARGIGRNAIERIQIDERPVARYFEQVQSAIAIGQREQELAICAYSHIHGMAPGANVPRDAVEIQQV